MHNNFKRRWLEWEKNKVPFPDRFWQEPWCGFWPKYTRCENTRKRLAEKKQRLPEQFKRTFSRENTTRMQTKNRLLFDCVCVFGGGGVAVAAQIMKKEFTWRDNVKLIWLARGWKFQKSVSEYWFTIFAWRRFLFAIILLQSILINIKCKSANRISIGLNFSFAKLLLHYLFGDMCLVILLWLYSFALCQIANSQICHNEPWQIRHNCKSNVKSYFAIVAILIAFSYCIVFAFVVIRLKDIYLHLSEIHPRSHSGFRSRTPAHPLANTIWTFKWLRPDNPHLRRW